MGQHTSRLSLFKISLVLGSALVAPATAFAEAAPAPAPAEAAAPTTEIIVTGFRKSLEAALNLKRNSVGAVDAIVAEDIAKFPDQNLAESLQRIPGIAVNRDGGEGREITVRGLGGQFTTVRVNGLEAQASTFKGPIKLEGDAKGKSVLILGAGVAGMV